MAKNNRDHVNDSWNYVNAFIGPWYLQRIGAFISWIYYHQSLRTYY